MKSTLFFGRVITTAFAALLVFGSPSARAGDAAAFTQLFQEDVATIETFNEQLVEAIKTSDYSKATATGDKLKALADKFVTLSKADDNKVWGVFAENMTLHAIELQKCLAAKDNPEMIVLSGALTELLGYMQSGNATWLHVYYPEQIASLGKALAAKDAENSAKYAEILHQSANRIATSSGFQKDAYTNTRWIDDIVQVAGLGDAIIAAAEKGDFAAADTTYKQLERSFAKWDKAFK